MMDQHTAAGKGNRSVSLIQGPTEDARPLRLVSVCALALVVGVVTGLGAVVFRGLIGLVHNFLFLGQFLFAYDSSVFTRPTPWGPLIILVPVLGAIGVTFIVSTFAPEAKGHWCAGGHGRDLAMNGLS